jgi:ATP-dependent Clp protease ATP-binding subunit ClpA
MTSEQPGTYTPRAQQALTLARLEARRLNHEFIGTEHLLLGLIKLDQGTAFIVLKKMGLELETVRMEIERQVGQGSTDQGLSGTVPYTPRAKRVLQLAENEARALGQQHVGTGHILLALLSEGDGMAARVLLKLDITAEEARQQVQRELTPRGKSIDLSPPALAKERTAEDAIVDLNKRYDIHCHEGNQEVVYRNALFIGTKKLFNGSDEFIAIQQVDGEVVLVSKISITKFSEHKET